MNKVYDNLYTLVNTFRGLMDPMEASKYLSRLTCYQILSSRTLKTVAEYLKNEGMDLDEAQSLYSNNKDNAELLEFLKNKLGYVIEAEKTIMAMKGRIKDDNFQIDLLKKALIDFANQKEEFADLFKGLDLEANFLGTDEQKIKRVSEFIKVLSELDETDFEQLLNMLSMERVNPPQEVLELATRLILHGTNNIQDGMEVYDPVMGSGSLLLALDNYINGNEKDRIRYYGQELDAATYDLARINMLVHGVDFDKQELRNGNALTGDWPADKKFDVIIMNPPYSFKWSAEDEFKEDKRFASYGVVPPKSKADYAFLLDGLYHLKDDGVMVIVLPHGVLFRGAAEGKIRQKLLEDGMLDAVIGLPANLFNSTAIPTVLLILKKNKTNRNVLFVDASKEFTKGKNQNVLTAEGIQKILSVYESRKDVEKFSHIADFAEIRANDFNLNIPRYVDTFEEKTIDLDQVIEDMGEIYHQIQMNETNLISLLKELKTPNKEVEASLKKLVDRLEKELYIKMCSQ